MTRTVILKLLTLALAVALSACSSADPQLGLSLGVPIGDHGFVALGTQVPLD